MRLCSCAQSLAPQGGVLWSAAAACAKVAASCAVSPTRFGGKSHNVTVLHPVLRLSAEHDNDPMALQEALMEEEKHSGVSHWIGSKIPASLHHNKIWRTIFWVRSCVACALLLAQHVTGADSLLASVTSSVSMLIMPTSLLTAEPRLTMRRVRCCLAPDRYVLCAAELLPGYPRHCAHGGHLHQGGARPRGGVRHQDGGAVPLPAGLCPSDNPYCNTQSAGV